MFSVLLTLTLVSSGEAQSYEQGASFYSSGELEKAYDAWLLAAWNGDSNASFALGAMNFNNEGTARNYANARAFYTDPKRATDARALTGMAVLYKYGRGVPMDRAKSLYLHQQAAALGYRTAIYNLGLAYSELGDYPQAIASYNKAEQLGVVQATHNLGRLYEKLKQYDLALVTYKRAADQGFLSSQVNLGQMYLEGLGTPKNAARAIGLFEAAAAAGHLDSMTNLGHVHKDGNGVPRDFQKAVQYFSVPAVAGDVNAQASLGWVHYRLEQYGEAVKWSKVAAARGDRHGQFNLARL